VIQGWPEGCLGKKVLRYDNLRLDGQCRDPRESVGGKTLKIVAHYSTWDEVGLLGIGG